MSEPRSEEKHSSRWYFLDDQKDVYKHPIFVFLIIVSIVLSTLLAIAISTEYRFAIGQQAFSTFLEISKLPLGVLSLGLILGVMFFRIHASKQKTRTLNESIRQNRFNYDVDKDRVYVELIRESFESVYELLKDKNNDNVIWVRASRLLLEALNLKSNVITNKMKKASDLLATQLRAKLYDVLTCSVIDASSRQALPAQFFYGITDWGTEVSIDEAAKKSSERIKSHRVVLDKVIPPPKSTGISPKAVIAIYDFLEFPSDYEDPLDEVVEWKDNWADSNGHIQGAKRYIYHRKNHSIIDGKIIKR